MFSVRLIVDPVNYRWAFSTLKDAIKFAKHLESGMKYVNDSVSGYQPKVEVYCGKEDISELIIK